MATSEVKEEQQVYVYLPGEYDKGDKGKHILSWTLSDKGKHILSWTLSHFPKDETKIIAIVIIPTFSTNYSDASINEMRERINETLDEHLTQCAIRKFKAEKLILENDDEVQTILELIKLREIKDFVMGFSINSEVVKEKANPSCKMWFIRNGNLIYTRENKGEMELQRIEKLYQKEIEEIKKRENDKNNLLKRENELLRSENHLLRDQQNDNLFELNELNKQKQQLGKLISDISKELDELKQQLLLSCQFSLSELEQATQNFSDLLKIGEGGFGCVYKGRLRGSTVAIKKLKLQGLSGFQQELVILTGVRHPNIVNLIGSCAENSVLILVYEFLPNGSLEDHLACAYKTSFLTWQVRIRIISEICSGLVFLHLNKPHFVIHGDLKPANIFLDANLISKLGDFGISKIIKQSDTDTTAVYHTSHPAGTIGYLDPQFIVTGDLTRKSDVYSFGIIMLRLLTGKPAPNIASEVQKDMRTGRLLSIVDQLSAGKWPFGLAKKLAELGMKCAEISIEKRPDMSEVLATIEPLVKAAAS